MFQHGRYGHSEKLCSFKQNETIKGRSVDYCTPQNVKEVSDEGAFGPWMVVIRR